MSFQPRCVRVSGRVGECQACGTEGARRAPLGPWSLSAGARVPGGHVSLPPAPLLATVCCQAVSETWVQAAFLRRGPCVSCAPSPGPRPACFSHSCGSLGSPLLGSRNGLRTRLPSSSPNTLTAGDLWLQWGIYFGGRTQSPRQEPEAKGGSGGQERGARVGVTPPPPWQGARLLRDTGPEPGIWRHGEVSMLAARSQAGPRGPEGGHCCPELLGGGYRLSASFSRAEKEPPGAWMSWGP